MAESNFSPTWRYNPIKHQLQFWTSPVEALVFEESLLKAILAMGFWRNCHHEALLKLPISTR